MPQEYVSIYDIEGVSFCCEASQSTFIFPGWKRAVAKTVLRPALKFTHGERPAGDKRHRNQSPQSLQFPLRVDVIRHE